MIVGKIEQGIVRKTIVIKLEKMGDFHKIDLNKDERANHVQIHLNLNWEAVKIS